MGNCGSEPKTNEGDAPEPERDVLVSNNEEVKDKLEQHSQSDEKSLGTLLNQNEKKETEEAEEPKKEEDLKTEEMKAEEEEKPEPEEEPKPEVKEEETRD